MFNIMEAPKHEPLSPFERPSGSGPTSDADVNAIVSLLVRHRVTMAVIFVGFLVMTALFTLASPRRYVAKVTLITGNNGTAALAAQDTTSIPILNALLASNGGQSPETYVALMEERPLAATVIKDLNLATTARALLGHIAVTPISNTAMLTLEASWSNPAVAAQIANDFANVFVERERDLVSGQAGSALDFLAKQIPIAQANLEKANSQLAAYEAAHSIADISNQTQQTISLVSTLESHIAQDQVDRGQAQAQLASVTGQQQSIASTIQGYSRVQANPILSQLESQLTNVEIQLQTAREQYTENYPPLIALEKQQAEIEKQIAHQRSTVPIENQFEPNPLFQQLDQQAANLRTQIAGDDAQIALLRGQLKAASSSLKKLPFESLRLADLQRQTTLAEDVYDALQKKQSEAIISQTASLGDVAVTEPASADDVRVQPSLTFNLAVGSVVGLFLAICGAFVLNFLDNSIKDEKDAQRLLGMPVLTSIPKITDKNRAALPWLRALTIEAFILLVSALRYCSDKPLRTFAVTSPMQGDGKSTVALNAAVAMAEVRPKVLLVDGDMRRPTLHEKLQLSNHCAGLSDLLVGYASLGSVVQATKFPGVDFLPGGFQPPNPHRLLQTSGFTALVNEMLKTYEAVIFDTPALAGIMDALAIAGKVEGTLLVVSAGATDARATRRALYRLESTEGVSVLGVILNQAEPPRRDGAYSNYYIDGITPLPLAGSPESA
jgi:polysaccharide biosynthesis transport protein